MAQNVFILEKELGFFITQEYPLMKFFAQIEHLEAYEKEQNRQQRKHSKPGRLK